MFEKCDIEFGNCVYCGKFRTITKDDIPPKNLLLDYIKKLNRQCKTKFSPFAGT